MATPSFRQPIRHGKDTGVPHTTSLGNALMTQIASVSGGFSVATQIARLPEDTEGYAITSNIHSFVLDLVTAQSQVSGNAGDTSFEIGTSGDATYFARIKISAAGRYLITTSNGSAGAKDKWFGLGNVPIYAKISAAGSGISANATGYITTLYIPR